MVGERDSKFYSELKQMNEDLLAFLKETNEKSPYFDFTPTLNDYVKQIEDLDKQYPEKAGESPAPKQTNIFNINASPFIPSAPIASAASNSLNNSISQPPASTLSFGQLNTNTQPTFIFGAPSNQIPAATSPSTFFSFTLPKKNEEENVNNANSEANAEAADDDEPPPDPKIDRYEEPDAKFSVKCKLYEKFRNEISPKLMGIGYIYLKTMDAPNKLQVIVRQEPDLRRVLLNDVISSNIPGQVKLLSKAVQLMFPSPTGELRFYIAKVKDEKDANALLDHLTMNK